MFIFLIRDERFKEIAGDILDKNWDIEEKEKEI
jgi:hypothetical protein